MLKNTFLIILTLLSFNALKAQKTITIIGKVTNVKGGSLIENVHIKVNQRNIVTKTNLKGEYSLVLQKKDRITLVFSHIKFETVYEPVSSSLDTLILNIKLKEKVQHIPEFKVEAENKPEIVFKSGKINVADYEFYEDKYLFLVYGKKLNKDSEIYLVDKGEQIISKHFVPGVPVELYTDYLGNVNLICKDAIYRIGIQHEKVSIYDITGKKILAFKGNFHVDYSFDISKLSNGIYMAKFEVNSSSVTKKLIVN